MWVDRRIVVNQPKSVRAWSPRKRKAWIRKAVLRSLWEVRKGILEESGEDIFGVSVRDDHIIINFRGDLESFRADGK